MVEIECPFCETSCEVDVASFTAAAFVLRCDECSVEVAVGNGPGVASLARAA